MEVSFFSCVLMLLLLHSFTLPISTKSIFNSNSDENALLAFKNLITNDDLSNNWSTNTSFCSWTGVSCSLNHRRVTALNLSGLDLVGTIAPHLGNLTFLQSLDISSNNFTGSIPSRLSNLRRLKHINVGANNLAGEIPSGIFTNMSSLIEIDMSVNQLSGQLPDDICGGNAPKLRRLDLTENQLFGKIPAGIYKCRNLVVLWFSENKFSGNIPTEIGNLTVLRKLSMYSNHLQGNVPSTISNISSLEYLDLYHNSLYGSIPTFYNTPKLQQLFLTYNNFTGGIPKEIGYLTSMTNLELTQNSLTGYIPKQLGNLTLLTQLDLAHNKLTGELPDDIGNLANLEIFAAPFNDFLSGSIPSSIFNISTLTHLVLQQNQFSGSLPPNMGVSLVNLQQLSLYFNRLSGEIPSSINNASMLTMLELNRNLFTGSIPDLGNLELLQYLRLWENNLTGAEFPSQELRFLSSLTNCPDLKVLEFHYNPLMNGILPASIGNLSTSLVTFLASDCSIRGLIPSEIGNLSSLQDLDLSGNKLTGSIPTTMRELKRLVKLNLYDNQLQGSIPSDLCQMSNLDVLDLSSNLLTGLIPECLGDIKTLSNVSLAFNKLNSTLPPNLLNLNDLIMLDLSSNHLSGQLPDQIGNLKAINDLNMSHNNFSGHIPSTISSCKSLVSLSLSNNKFNESIPQSLGELRGLITLDLSINDLSGVIPESLAKLDLHYFNVSYNKLKGEIPDFKNFTAASFLHNPLLCSETRSDQFPHCRKSTSKSVSRVILVYIVPPFIAVMILAVGMLVLIRRCGRKNPPPSAETPSAGVGWKIISERELKQGTSSFSETNLLGKGGVGTVYKATLADGTNVAVKVFNLQLEGATKSFDTESKILSTIRHRNLVKILGCCSNTEFKALILAYMPNGSLEKWLHSDKYSLDLEQSLKIAIDVALALEYLHHDHTYTVVHCDIKPTNVLLDADMTAHVGDFGIAKLFDNGDTAVLTRNIATTGYAAPEFGSDGKVSTSGDVYGYGILLLEMLTSKRPTDDMFNAEMSIKEWVDKALQENKISEVVASGLLSREDRHLSSKLQCVSSIFDLAMKCLAFSPDERINMIQVVAALQKIKAKFPVEEVKKRHRRS